MRLMQILLSQAEAGAETYFEKVATAFASHSSVIQRLVIEALPSREKRLTRAGVDFRALPMGRFGKMLFYDRQLKKAVNEFNPDLIVTWVNRASRKCPETEAVVVGRLGGYYDIENYKKCDHLIVNTPDLVRHVVSRGWPKSAVNMISNFGELPAVLDVPESLPDIPEGHKVLLALGRLHVKKAHDILIKALTRIPETTLLIAGNGELQRELQELAEFLTVRNRVHFLGLRKDIRGLFERADICVFPSRFEPLGNVILEAWATGTPVVAAASQGPSWLIDHERNGILFDVDDVDGCAESINRLLSDPELCEKLAWGGRNSFYESFSMEVIINQYLSLFKSLLEKKHDAARLKQRG